MLTLTSRTDQSFGYGLHDRARDLAFVLWSNMWCSWSKTSLYLQFHHVSPVVFLALLAMQTHFPSSETQLPRCLRRTRQHAFVRRTARLSNYSSLRICQCHRNRKWFDRRYRSSFGARPVHVRFRTRTDVGSSYRTRRRWITRRCFRVAVSASSLFASPARSDFAFADPYSGSSLPSELSSWSLSSSFYRKRFAQLLATGQSQLEESIYPFSQSGKSDVDLAPQSTTTRCPLSPPTNPRRRLGKMSNPSHPSRCSAKKTSSQSSPSTLQLTPSSTRRLLRPVLSSKTFMDWTSQSWVCVTSQMESDVWWRLSWMDREWPRITSTLSEECKRRRRRRWRKIRSIRW